MDHAKPYGEGGCSESDGVGADDELVGRSASVRNGWGGWLTAFGGAWKDAPVEGFETFKFFRSPGISLAWAILVSFFTDNWLYLGIAGAEPAIP